MTMNLIKIKVVRELCLKGENFQPGAIVPVTALEADAAVSRGAAQFASADDRRRTNEAIPHPDTRACPIIRELRATTWTQDRRFQIKE